MYIHATEPKNSQTPTGLSPKYSSYWPVSNHVERRLLRALTKGTVGLSDLNIPSIILPEERR